MHFNKVFLRDKLENTNLVDLKIKDKDLQKTYFVGGHCIITAVKLFHMENIEQKIKRKDNYHLTDF